jgi:hypothetical protein
MRRKTSRRRTKTRNGRTRRSGLTPGGFMKAFGGAVDMWAPLLEWGWDLVRELFEDIERERENGDSDDGADRRDSEER